MLTKSQTSWAQRRVHRIRAGSAISFLCSLALSFNHLVSDRKQPGGNLSPETGSPQLVEQCLGVLQDRRVETFGEPAVERREQTAGFGAFALVAPEAGEADSSS